MRIRYHSCIFCVTPAWVLHHLKRSINETESENRRSHGEIFNRKACGDLVIDKYINWHVTLILLTKRPNALSSSPGILHKTHRLVLKHWYQDRPAAEKVEPPKKMYRKFYLFMRDIQVLSLDSVYFPTCMPGWLVLSSLSPQRFHCLCTHWHTCVMTK